MEQKATTEFAAAKARAEALSKLNVTITQKAGEEGRLYGSVGVKDIADAVTAAGVELHKKEVRLPTGPIRHTGDFDIKLHIHADLDAIVTVKIVGE